MSLYLVYVIIKHPVFASKHLINRVQWLSKSTTIDLDKMLGLKIDMPYRDVEELR